MKGKRIPWMGLYWAERRISAKLHLFYILILVMLLGWIGRVSNASGRLLTFAGRKC
jgi:hypothetical protein